MSASATSADEIRSRLEAIAGHAIDLTAEQIAEQLVIARPRIAAYSFLDAGRVVSRNLIIPNSPLICDQRQVLDMVGYGYTAASGSTTFSINELLCPNEGFRLLYEEPVNVLVTANTDRPFFATMVYVIVYTPPPNPLGTDLRITVHTWQPNGTPAPQTKFHWRCRVPFPQTIG